MPPLPPPDLPPVSVHAAHVEAPPEVPRAAPPPPAEGTPTRVVYGYLPYWGVGPEDVPWEHLTHLAVFGVGVDADGGLTSLSRWTDVAADAVARGHAAGTKVHLCVLEFDPDAIEALLSSASRRATLVDALGAQVEAYGADGVNVDFEGVPVGARDELVAFVEELKPRVGEVWLASPAVDWSDAWDVAALTEAADGLFVMGYAYHWTSGDAGPNAPLEAGDLWPWWTLAWTVDDYLANGADPSRLVLGLPLYGQAWPVADADEVPATTTGDGWSVIYATAVAEAERAGRAWEPASATPWYAAEAAEQTWYDDADSLALKMAWALEDEGLGGVGFWAVGYDGNDPALWAEVDALTRAPAGEGDTSDTSDAPDDGPPSARRIEGEAAGCACGTTGPGGTFVVGVGALAAAALARRRCP